MLSILIVVNCAPVCVRKVLIEALKLGMVIFLNLMPPPMRWMQSLSTYELNVLAYR